MSASEGGVRTWAERYVKLGWAVLPIQRDEKEPVYDLAPHAVKSATQDLARIAEWWPPRSSRAALNIGGTPPADHVIVDVDGPEGLLELQATDRELPSTATQKTIREGGLHLVYTLPPPPEGFEYRQKDPIPGKINTRLHGRGYVVLEPSRRNGSSYHWAVPPKPDNITPAPEWLVQHLLEPVNGNGDRETVEPTGTTEIPEDLLAKLEDGRTAAGWLWAGKKAKGDTSGSGMDASLAGTLGTMGFDDSAVEAALRAYPHGRVSQTGDGRQLSRLLGIAAVARAGRIEAQNGPTNTAGEDGSCPRCGKDSCEGCPETGQPRAALEFLTVRELVARVAAAGPRRYLLRGLWPAGDYGIHAAEAKAQKTWNTVDAAVSVASGEPWLGHVPVDDSGPVLLLAGEGGQANVWRRIRATAEAKGIDAEELPITVCTRAPHLGDDEHLRLLGEQIERLQPRLVTLDPLYLAAAGANLANLYEMGAMLERVQLLCSDAGASLWVTTHFNRKEGKGQARILGAGPAEWGRVLLTATVHSRHTHPETRETDVVSELAVVGGEVADQALRLRRRIWADDPDDLDSPLHLEVTVTDVDEPTTTQGGGLPPAAQKLLGALRQGPATSTVLVDRIAKAHGHGLYRSTVSRQLNDLAQRGLAEADEAGAFEAKVWRLVEGAS